MNLCWTWRSTGQSQTEYIIIGALVIGLALPAILFLSQNLKSAMGDIIPKRQGSLLSKTKGAAAPAKPTTPYVEESAVSASVNASNSLSAAQKAVLRENLTVKVQTLGANGTTTLLANQLSILAKQLLDEGKIDQTEYAAIMDLSNQGHRMALIEGKLEAAILESQGNSGRFNGTRIMVDGQAYTPFDLSQRLGYTQVGPGGVPPTELLNPKVPASAELQQFLSLYKKVEAMGLMNDPTVKATIDSASLQIAGLGEMVEHAVYMSGGDAKTLKTEQDVRKAISESAGHFESSRICKAGDFQDNGVQCSP